MLATDGENANGATLLLSGRKTSIGGAALANAALFHGRCQEDTCGTVHLGAVVIPMLTAMVEARNIPWRGSCRRCWPDMKWPDCSTRNTA